MKTTLLIGFVLLAQQAIDARNVIHFSDSSEECQHKQTSTPVVTKTSTNPPVSTHSPLAITNRYLDSRFDKIRTIEPKCPQQCTSLYDYKPVCGKNSGQIVLFYHNCVLETAKCRNADITWDILPVATCMALIEPQPYFYEQGVIGVVYISQNKCEESNSLESWEVTN